MRTHAGIICTPYGKLTTKHKEEVLLPIVRLNRGRGDSSMIAAFSKELMELDMGDWHELADVAPHLVMCDNSADPTKLQTIISIKPDFLRSFWLTKSNKLFPHLTVAAKKASQQITHILRSQALLECMGPHLHLLAQQPWH